MMVSLYNQIIVRYAQFLVIDLKIIYPAVIWTRVDAALRAMAADGLDHLFDLFSEQPNASQFRFIAVLVSPDAMIAGSGGPGP
jgi:hypothetical protein